MTSETGNNGQLISDEAVVTEKLIDHYFLSHLSPVKPRRTIKLQPINHATNKQSTNR